MGNSFKYPKSEGGFFMFKSELQSPIITMESREVAVAAEKRHTELLRDIRKYIEYMEFARERKFASTDFFIESIYTSEQGKTYPCYLITRKGCEFIANKMTGKKGTLFTAAYISKFHEMEAELINPPKPEPPALDLDMLKQYQSLAECNDIPDRHKDGLLDHLYRQITGKEPVQAMTQSEAKNPALELFDKRTARLIAEPISPELFWHSLGEYTLDAIGGEEHIPQFMDYLTNLLEETKGMTLKETADYAERMAGIGRLAT